MYVQGFIVPVPADKQDAYREVRVQGRVKRAGERRRPRDREDKTGASD